MVRAAIALPHQMCQSCVAVVTRGARNAARRKFCARRAAGSTAETSMLAQMFRMQLSSAHEQY